MLTATARWIGIAAAGVSTSGEIREVTVLFADIVEFTALSETLHPETLVRMLNGYFEAAWPNRGRA
jgi:class 3 adenylate cyclase